MIVVKTEHGYASLSEACIIEVEPLSYLRMCDGRKVQVIDFDELGFNDETGRYNEWLTVFGKASSYEYISYKQRMRDLE